MYVSLFFLFFFCRIDGKAARVEALTRQQTVKAALLQEQREAIAASQLARIHAVAQGINYGMNMNSASSFQIPRAGNSPGATHSSPALDLETSFSNEIDGGDTDNLLQYPPNTSRSYYNERGSSAIQSYGETSCVVGGVGLVDESATAMGEIVNMVPSQQSTAGLELLKGTAAPTRSVPYSKQQQAGLHDRKNEEGNVHGARSSINNHGSSGVSNLPASVAAGIEAVLGRAVNMQYLAVRTACIGLMVDHLQLLSHLSFLRKAFFWEAGDWGEEFLTRLGDRVTALQPLTAYTVHVALQDALRVRYFG